MRKSILRNAVVVWLVLIVFLTTSACSLLSNTLRNVADAIQEEPTDKPVVIKPSEPTATPRPEITEASFCSDIDEDSSKCLNPTSDFGVYDKIYFTFHIRNYPSNTNFEAVWYYGDGKEIYRYDFSTKGTRYMHFFVVPGSQWKTGQAYLHLYVDGNLYDTYYFDIR